MKLFKHHFRVMGGPAELQLFAESEGQALEMFMWAEAEARRIEVKYSRYLGDSVLSKINASAGSVPIEVDSETSALIDYAFAAYHQSNGLFDITSGVLRQVWDFKKAVVPSKEALNNCLALIGLEKLSWDCPNLYLPQSGMELDFGGLAKEYAVDRLAGILAPKCSHGMINLAGDVRVLGPRVDGSPWMIGIVHPRRPGNTVASIAVSKGALATSGDYERYFEVSGVRYCHILNPKSGWPASDLQSVSIVSESCLVAGTATTSAMLLGERAGLKYLADLDASYIVVTKSSEVIEDFKN